MGALGRRSESCRPDWVLTKSGIRLSEDLLYLAILGIVKPYILKNPRIKFFKVIAIKILKDYIFDPFLLI